tara:strand:- start:143 stop:745 length:603 start_codon:yes stop_codon:yes gene_type:complete
LKRLVYLVSPNKIYKSFYPELTKVLKTKRVKFFQLRLKKMNKNQIITIGKKIKKITKKYNVKLIINDSADVAKKIKADGYHIGQSDGSISEARELFPKKIVGVTCHNSKKLAIKAIKNKASYVAFGSFFDSNLKPNAKKADLKILKWAKKNVKKPIVVIGGITDKNYKKLIKSGANFIAISSFIWDNPALKPDQAIGRFK